MTRSLDRRLRVFSWCFLLPALAIVGCDKPATRGHPVLGGWIVVGEGGVDLAELRFFPNGRCRFTYGGQKMLFCGWDPAAEKAGFVMRFGPLLPINDANGTVAGDEMILVYENAAEGFTWIRAGSQHEQNVKASVRGQELFASGETEKAIAEWTAAADRGDRAVQNNLAWLLATAQDPKLHDGKKAIAYAEKAVAQERIAAYLDTLAAALARDGQFEKAVQVQEEALALLAKDPDQYGEEDVQHFTERLALYKAGKAYTEPATAQ